MAVAFSLLDTFAITTENDTSINTTASVTPTNGRLLLVAVVAANVTTSMSAISLSGWSQTFTAIPSAELTIASGSRRLKIFGCIVSGATAGVATVTSPDNIESLRVDAVECTGFDNTSLANAVTFAGSNSDTGINIATGITVSTAAFTRDGSGGLFAAFVSNKNQLTANDAATTELTDLGSTLPVIALEVQVQTTENTTVDAFPASDNTIMGGICLEVRAAAAAAVAVPSLTLTNGATNWGLPSSAGNMNAFYSFAVHKSNLYAGGRQDSGGTNPDCRMLRSPDGRGWQVIATGASTANEFRRLHSGSDGYLYATTEEATPKMYRTFDGDAWSLVWTSDDAAGDNYGRSFAELGTRIYLAVKGNSAGQARMIRSNAGPDGATWAVSIDNIANATNLQILTSGSNLFLFTDEPAVYKTTDGTTLGSRIDAAAQWLSGTNVLHDPVVWNSALWVGSQNTTRGCALYKSSDTGATWRRQTEFGLGVGTAEEELYALRVISVAGTDYLLIGTFNQSGGSVYITADGMNLTRIGSAGFADPATTYEGVFQFSPSVQGKVYTASRVTAVSDTTQTFPMVIEGSSGTVITSTATIKGSLTTATSVTDSLTGVI